MTEQDGRGSGLRPGEVARVVGGRHHPDDRPPTTERLQQRGEPYGEGAQLLRIGSVAIELVGLDARLAGLVAAHYEGFAVGTGAVPTVTAGSRPVPVEIFRCDEERFLYSPRADGGCEEARLDGRSTDQGLELWSYDWAGAFDRDGQAGRLFLCDVNDSDAGQAIENFLRFFVSTAALRLGGFLLHASGVLHEGRAFVFFGPSGAGKSTTMANAPDGSECLGDDLVLLEKWRDGFRACGVPFRGSFAGGERNSSSAGALAMACRLFQATENRLEDASKAVQLAELLGELPFLMEDAELQRRAAERVKALIARVPVRRLHLKNDGSYWELLS